MSLSTIDPRSVGLAIITSYPKWYDGKLRSIKHTEKIRGDLALEFFTLVSKLGYRAVCVDSHSTKLFKKYLSTIPGIQIIHKKTASASEQKRLAIKKISQFEGIAVIVLSEPEKISFLQHLSPIIMPILQDKLEIVLPKRKDILFKSSYPDYMYVSETEGNKMVNEIFQAYGLMNKDIENMDSFFGPKAFANNPQIIQLFTKMYLSPKKGSFVHPLMSPEAYSNIMYIPLIQAILAKKRMKNVEIPFTYPLIQKENEQVGAVAAFIEKRTMQRMGIIINIIHFLSHLKKI